MQPPRIEIVPARPAVCSDQESVLDVLARIVPPAPDIHFLRPPINLGIVLDRSGSMAEGRKLVHAREAACFAIGQLLPTDRASITIFDEEIETIAPSAAVSDKPGLMARVRGVQPRGGTALHEGWVAGASQVAEHVAHNGLNRVLLLSDGRANAGVTDPNTIRAEVQGMTSRGVSTSTIGVGDDYNEDLLEAMAQAGDGNYYYVETPVQLSDIFQTEMNGLMATVGRDVGLRIETAQGAAIVEVLTELDREPSGRLKLANLIVGMPISIVVRLRVPAREGVSGPCRFVLDWEEPRGAAPGRRTQTAALALPAVPSHEWSAMPLDPAVAEQVALLMAAKARKELIAAIDRGDEAAANSAVGRIRAELSSAPLSAEMASEWADLDATQQMLDHGQAASARKSAHYRQYNRKQGRSGPPST